MKSKLILVATGAISLAFLVAKARSTADRSPANSVVRLAELEIDPAQLEGYKIALREEVGASIRTEPGVLKLYAVSVKDQPNQIRLFEMYASPTAYQAHLESAHFKKYKAATADMVRSLRLVETTPIALGSK